MATEGKTLKPRAPRKAGNARKQTLQAGISSVNYDEVARVAYLLYEQRGYAHGYDQEDWVKAEQIVRQRGAAR